MKKKYPGYIGRISASGASFVQAPIQPKPGKAPAVKEGEDLRTGKSK